MAKTLKVVLIILGVIIIGLVLAYFLVFSNKGTDAYLYIDSGVVQVNQGKGWVAATNEMGLKETDSVKTLEGTATIIFYESEILRLKQNTEVNIKDISKDSLTVKQNSGKTWSKVVKLTGVTSYNVETPDTVATVRGTGFGTLVSDGSSDILVGEGIVNVSGNLVELKHKIKAVKGKHQQIKEMDENDLKFTDGENIKDLNDIKRVRMHLIKASNYYKIGKTQGVNDEILESYLNAIDNGDLKEKDLLDKYHLKGKTVDDVIRINKLIRERYMKHG